jgi:cytoskeletal protein CcmA (bactofilin family)
MKLKLFILLPIALIASFFTLSLPAQAKEYRSGATTEVTKNDFIDSSLTSSSAKQKIDGTINGNFYCSGQDVEISGVISGSVYCASQKFNLSGRVDGDLFVISNTTEVSGIVNGSISAFSSSIKLTESAKVRQDISAFVSTANISGIIARDVELNAGTARIGATIGRNLSGNYGSLTLYGDAYVRGNLNYTSNSDVKLENNAKIDGKTNRTAQVVNMAGGVAAGLFTFLGFLVSLLIVSMVTVLIFPNFYEKTYAQIHTKTGASFGWGIFNLLVTPLIIGLIMITVLGIPLAGLIAVAWILSLMLSGPIFAYYVGKKVKKKSSPVLTMLIGSLIVLSLYILPVINVIVGAIVGIVGSGALFNLVKTSKLQLKK